MPYGTVVFSLSDGMAEQKRRMYNLKPSSPARVKCTSEYELNSTWSVLTDLSA